MKKEGERIVVDLGQSHKVCHALSLLASIPERQSKVKHAHVVCMEEPLPKLRRKNSKGKKSSKSKSLGTKELTEVFKALGDLTNLTSLTIDLNYMMELPIQVLFPILTCAAKLQSLEFRDVRFQSNDWKEIESLQSLLEECTSLKSMTISHVRGPPEIMESLLLGPPALERIEVVSSAVSSCCCRGRSCGETTGNTSLCCQEIQSRSLERIVKQSPRLKALHLVELPLGQISDEHVKALAMNLSWTTCTLQELSIVSSWLTATSGEAICHMMMLNESITRLQLHLDWEDHGPMVADMIRMNCALRSLDLRVYGDYDQVQDCLHDLALALYQIPAEKGTPTSSSLSELRMCFEFDPDTLVKDKLLKAFEKAIKTNDTLHELTLTDSLTKRQLNPSLQTKLTLNKLRVPQLLRDTACTSECDCSNTMQQQEQQQHEGLVNAIVAAKNDTNVVFHILSNCPSMIGPQEAAAVCTATPSSSTSASKTNSSVMYGLLIRQYDQAKHPLTSTSSGKNSKKHYYRKVTGPAIGRRLKSLLAPSA